MLAGVKQQLLFVLREVENSFSPYRSYMKDEDFKRDYYRDLIASVLLIPTLAAPNKLPQAREMLEVLELRSVAQDVHNRLAETGEKEYYCRPILIGDYGLSVALEHLVRGNNQNWLTAFCNAHCAVSEMRAVRSSWRKQGFVSEEERKEVFQKEYTQFPVLAARFVAKLSDFSEEASESLAGFAYYAGELAGRHRESFFLHWENVVEMACSHLSDMEDKSLADVLFAGVLEPMVRAIPDKGNYSLKQVLARA